jgi:GTP-binding protein
MSSHNQLRNVAIIAHVDHGKTTLVDKLLAQSGTIDVRKDHGERIMDSNDLERERGITILSKNTAIRWKDHQINIVDTPGHADFGGEVERVLSMVDSVLLLVDAVDGPMPQTRFVTRKAFDLGLKPIVVINKVDRPGARPHEVLDETFELFDRLGATDDQLEFLTVYASALNGYAGLEIDELGEDMTPLLDALIDHVPAPKVDIDGPLQMQVSSLGYTSFTGVIGVGRIHRGSIAPRQQVSIVGADGSVRKGKVLEVQNYHGLERIAVDSASAGAIVSITGLGALRISDTICAVGQEEALPALRVDQPTVNMSFEINTSPLAGRDGKFVTSRQIRERLDTELLHNVALRVEDTDKAERWTVCGRGELHLAVLIETMRREGYELAVGRPQVINKTIDGVVNEPWERLVCDFDENYQGPVMESLGLRKGELQDMVPDGSGRLRVVYAIPTRGLLGFQTEFLTMTRGTGLMHRVFEAYKPKVDAQLGGRHRGVLIANGAGKAIAYALFNLQNRGAMFVGPGEEVYEGMVIGIHIRDNDLVVNPLKGKQLTNVRAAGSDENVILTPPLDYSLEQCLEFLDDDELLEVTPTALRIRKRHLKEFERRIAAKRQS